MTSRQAALLALRLLDGRYHLIPQRFRSDLEEKTKQ